MAKPKVTRVLSLFCVLVLCSLLSLSTQGGKEGGYALFGSKSSDKRATIKAVAILVRDFNALFDSFMKEIEEFSEEYYRLWDLERERMLGQ
jgi:hypothetical protein